MATGHSHIVTRGSMKLAHNNDRRDDFKLKHDGEDCGSTPVSVPMYKKGTFDLDRIAANIKAAKAALAAKECGDNE